MFYPVSAFIGLRYAKASKGSSFIAFINFFSVAGIALGLMSLMTVLAVMNGFEGELKLRNLGLTPHILIEGTQHSEETLRQIDAIKGVNNRSLHIESEGLVQSAHGLQGVKFYGVEPDILQQSSVIAENMTLGKLTELTQGSYGIVIGRALSIKLQLRVGDKARLIASENSFFGPFGRMYSQRVFKVVGIFDMGSSLDDKVILMNVHDGAKLLRSKTDQLAENRLFLEDAFDYIGVTEQLAELGVSSTSWRTQQGALFDAVKMEKNMMSLMLLLIIAVAAFNIVSALVMVVTEKQGDIAILLTQGMRRKNIMYIFLFNGAYNGIKGTIVGVLLGLLLIFNMNNLLTLLQVPIFLGPDGQNLPIDLQWSQVTWLVLTSLLLCFAASWYPAYRALKVEPAQALKYE